MKNLTEEEFTALKEKADSYDEISDKIANFYDDDNPDNEGVDTCTIGEWICSYLGFL